MNPVLRVLIHPWRGVQEARAALEQSERERARSERLRAELEHIERVNGITARFRDGMRGRDPDGPRNAGR